MGWKKWQEKRGSCHRSLPVLFFGTMRIEMEKEMYKMFRSKSAFKFWPRACFHTVFTLIVVSYKNVKMLRKKSWQALFLSTFFAAAVAHPGKNTYTFLTWHKVTLNGTISLIKGTTTLLPCDRWHKTDSLFRSDLLRAFWICPRQLFKLILMPAWQWHSSKTAFIFCWMACN